MNDAIAPFDINNEDVHISGTCRERDDEQFHIDSVANVTVKESLRFCVGKLTVATLDASYDFSSLPQPLHEMALSIVNARQNVCIDIDLAQALGINVHKPKEPPLPQTWRQKITRWFQRGAAQ